MIFFADSMRLSSSACYWQVHIGDEYDSAIVSGWNGQVVTWRSSRQDEDGEITISWLPRKLWALYMVSRQGNILETIQVDCPVGESIPAGRNGSLAYFRMMSAYDYPVEKFAENRRINTAISIQRHELNV